ncbi:polysaccharide biosynthesis/export family protein [Tranquillimonas rosea]|uniref:polysaccharide biosynthesis/export family protein n=1 Tax=Tranquillimonas rosea TaxID=641238 RepID=UPI003BA9C0E3
MTPLAKMTLRLVAVLMAVAWPLFAGAAPVERGDVLRIEVTDAEDFSREANVDLDGRIMMPGLGSLQVAGKEVDAIRAQIETALVERDLLKAPKVLVEIAAYRPVYVGGAVAQPGAIAFVPGLTPRQAIISAGGLSLKAEERAAAPEDIVQVIARSRATAYHLAQVEARIARLETELSGDETIETAPAATGVSEATVATILETEGAILRERLGRDDAVSGHLSAVLDLLDLELDILEQQADLQQSEAQNQSEEIDNARTLVERGLMPRPRLQEMLRESSQLNRDLLENRAFAARARQAKETARYEIEDTKTRTRIDLREELLEARRAKVELEASMQGLRAQMLNTGLALTEDTRLAPPEPRITLHRGAAEQTGTTELVMDAPLQPGDVLEVVLDTDLRG